MSQCLTNWRVGVIMCDMNTTCTHCGTPARWADADGEFRCEDCRAERKATAAKEEAARVAAANERDANPKYDHTMVDNVNRR